METSNVQFIEKLLQKSEYLKEITEKIVEYWSPDPVPTIILFSEIGREFAQRFETLTSEEIEQISHLVEEGMSSGDDVLKTAIATGMVEAIFSEAYKHEGLSQKIGLHLGNVSKRYVDAWMNSKF